MRFLRESALGNSIPARGLAAVRPVGWGRTVQVARIVHVTYWVPAGWAMDATAGGPSIFFTSATGVP